MVMKIDTSKLTDVDIYKLILKGELKKFPDQFWTKPGAFDSAKEITKYFIEELMKWNEDQVKENLTESVFRKHKLSGMLEYVFGRSPYKAIENAYPGKYNPWDFRNAYKGIWNKENMREEAVKWLLKKVHKDKFNELTNLDFLNNGLGGLMDYLHKKKVFNNLNKTKVEDGLLFTERELTVSFNKSGGTSSRNGVTTRVTIPTSWIRSLGITEENRVVTVKLENDRIIIEPKK